MLKFNRSVEIAKKQFPKLSIKYKNESYLMKLLGMVLFFNRGFGSKYITTIGNTIYFPSKQFIENNETSSIIVLCHELVHIKQKQSVDLFELEYLFPQVISLFSLFAFFNIYFLLFLLFLLPIPSITRFMFEYEAYLVTIYCKKKLNLNYNIENIIKQFTGPDYYFMYPFKDNVKTMLDIGVNMMDNESFYCFGIKDTVDQIMEVLDGS